MAELPAELRTAAWFYSQNESNPPALGRFEAQLQQHGSPAMLVLLAQQFASSPSVSTRALERLVQLAPNNVGYLCQLGFAHFMAGEDIQAAEWLARAQTILPNDLEVLNLEAALSRTDDAKRKVYAKMLSLYPDNRAAFENLVLLREDEEHAD